MALTLSEDFELPDGTLITAANTAFDAVGGDGTVQADTAFRINGTASCEFICATITENNRLDHVFTLAGQRWFQWYFRPPDPLTVANRPFIAGLFAGVTERASVRIENDGRVGVRNGIVQVATTTSTVIPGEWNRLDWSVVNLGNNTLRLFNGANLNDPSSFTEEISAAYAEGTFDTWSVGPWVAADAWTFNVDGVRVDDTAFPAPSGGSVGDPDVGFLAQLNRLAGTQDLGAAGAANTYAGTSGLEVVGALNVAAGTTGLDLQGVCNDLAGTNGLGTVEALSRIIA